LDNLAGYILPNFVSAFGVFMMTSFYRSFPKELEEAVILDGATRWGIFFRIVLPLSQTQLLTLGLLAALEWWQVGMWTG
jgi:multiple sugar transport system permease protein